MQKFFGSVTILAVLEIISGAITIAMGAFLGVLMGSMGMGMMDYGGTAVIGVLSGIVMVLGILSFAISVMGNG